MSAHLYQNGCFGVMAPGGPKHRVALNTSRRGLQGGGGRIVSFRKGKGGLSGPMNEFTTLPSKSRVVMVSLIKRKSRHDQPLQATPSSSAGGDEGGKQIRKLLTCESRGEDSMTIAKVS